MKLKPLFDRVVLKVEKKEEKNVSGIILPIGNDDKSQIGIVVACGEGGIIDGKEITMKVKENDRVLFSKFAGTEIKVDGEDYLVVRQTDILLILE